MSDRSFPVSDEETSHSASAGSTISSEHFSDLSLFCILATSVPAKLRITATTWSFLAPSDRSALLQVSKSESQDLQHELVQLAIALGFSHQF